MRQWASNLALANEVRMVGVSPATMVFRQPDAQCAAEGKPFSVMSAEHFEMRASAYPALARESFRSWREQSRLAVMPEASGGTLQDRSYMNPEVCQLLSPGPMRHWAPHLALGTEVEMQDVSPTQSSSKRELRKGKLQLRSLYEGSERTPSWLSRPQHKQFSKVTKLNAPQRVSLFSPCLPISLGRDSRRVQRKIRSFSKAWGGFPTH